MTLPELNLLVNGLRQKKKDALASTGGSYHVLLQFDSSGHMSWSDLPFLQAKNEREATTAREMLATTCRYTREFFDVTLKGLKSPLYKRNERLKYIELVKKYQKFKGDK
jgi:hypothetical protein